MQLNKQSLEQLIPCLQKQKVTQEVSQENDLLDVIVSKVKNQRLQLKNQRHEVLSLIKSSNQQCEFLLKGADTIKRNFLHMDINGNKACTHYQNVLEMQCKELSSQGIMFRNCSQLLENLNYQLQGLKVKSKQIIKQAEKVYKRLKKQEKLAQGIKQSSMFQKPLAVDFLNSENLLNQIRKSYSEVKEIELLGQVSQEIDAVFLTLNQEMLSILQNLVICDNLGVIKMVETNQSSNSQIPSLSIQSQNSLQQSNFMESFQSEQSQKDKLVRDEFQNQSLKIKNVNQQFYVPSQRIFNSNINILTSEINVSINPIQRKADC